VKGLRFYEQYKTSKRKESIGTVVAVLIPENPLNTFLLGTPPRYECVAGVYDLPNSPVMFSTCTFSYVRDCCKRISEAKAREIHPKLFEYLDGGQ